MLTKFEKSQKENKMQLSYSSLSVFKSCPRCFYLDRKLKIPRPQGIKSGMPGVIDLILKNQMAPFGGALPPMLQGIALLDGFQIYNGPDLKKMQYWKTNPLKMEDGKGM